MKKTPYSVPVYFETAANCARHARNAVIASLDGLAFDGPDYPMRVTVGYEDEIIDNATKTAPAACRDELLHRAHDFLCHTTEAQSRDDRHGLIDDIRVALGLDLTDCENCDAVIPTSEAIEKGTRVLCRECAVAD